MIVTTAAAISLTAWLTDKLGEKAIDAIFSSGSERDIDKRFEQAIKETAEHFTKQSSNSFNGDLRSLLLSKNIFPELIKVLFQDSKVDIKKIKEQIDNDSVSEEFIEEVISYLKTACLKDFQLQKIFSDQQLYVTIIGVGKDIETLKDLTTLSTDSILQIKELIEQNFNERFSINDFIEKYSSAAKNCFSEINFIGLGIKSHIKKNKKKLFDVYVQPKFSLVDSLVSGEDNDVYPGFDEEGIELKDLFSENKNLVILGKPGSGKSLLVKYLICSILNKNNGIRNENILNRIPFRIELRKYLENKKADGTGLLRYLSRSFETDFGILKPSDTNIELIFNTRKSIVFFDGLDEIFSAQDKIDVKTDIENFILSYDNTWALVTSRVHGYDEARLSKDVFKEYQINDFDDEQIREYAEKWYQHEEMDVEIRDKEVKEFLSAAQSIDEELVSNPLLLSLIIILFRNDLKLPESKLEIYQSCTKTLVDKWDQTKGLKIELNEEISKKKETLFADLAFWQYEAQSIKEKRITNKSATTEIAKSIINKLKITDDWIEGETLAEDFMHYAQKRSLYFDNNFTHKTFLEYYTAYWIYSNIEKKLKKEDRDNIISKYIANSYWYIVLELLINMIDQDQADNEIVDELYENQVARSIEALPLLIDIFNTLKNISTSTIFGILYTSLNYISNTVRRNDADNNLPQRIYQSISRFTSFPSLAALFTEAFAKFQLKSKLDDKEYKRLLLFYLELFRRDKLRINITIEAVQDKVRLQKLVDTDHLVYLIHRSITGIRRWDSLEEIEYQLLKFGDSSFYNDIPLTYDKSLFLSPINTFFHIYFSNEEIGRLGSSLQYLFSKGLSKINFLKKLRSHNYYLSTVKPKLLLDTFNNEDDELIKAIIILIVWKVIKRGNLESNYKSSYYPLFSAKGFKDYLQLDNIEKVFEKLSEQYNIQMYLPSSQ